MSLSDKMVLIFGKMCAVPDEDWLRADDVKQFIKELKEKIHNGPDGYDRKSHKFIDWINALAGEGLI